MGASPSTTKNTLPPKWADPVWPSPPNLENLVFGVRIQTTQFGAWRPECKGCHGGGCDAGECSAFTAWDKCSVGGPAKMYNAMNVLYTPDGLDPTFYIENCYCSSRPSCTRPDTTAGLLGKGSAGYDPLWRADWADLSDTSHAVRYSYDISKIDRIEQAERFKQLFDPQPDNDSWRRIMQKLCSQRSGNCPLDPTSKLPNQSCSIVTALPSQRGSELCRQWFNGLGPQNRDTFIDQVCDPNERPIRTECKCQLRQQMLEYQQTTDNLYLEKEVDTACFWTPCKASGSKTFLVNSSDSHPNCPQNLCETVYLVNGTAGNVTVSQNQAYLGCSFKPQAGSASEPTHPDNQGQPVPPPIKPVVEQTDTAAAAARQQGLRWIGIVLIICLMLGSIAAFAWKGHR